MTRKEIAPSDALAVNALMVAVRQSANVICDRWSISILLAALLGARRFNDFVEQTGLSGKLLSSRLSRLQADGILIAVPYNRRPPRSEYLLTNMGKEFFNVVIEMVRWEQAWTPDPSKSVFQLINHQSPELLEFPLVCAACKMPITARDTSLHVSQARLQRMPPKQTSYRRSTINSASGVAARALLGESLDILGDKWSIEVINCAFLRLHHFGDFKQQTGIAANILTDRLNRLVTTGFLTRENKSRSLNPTRGYWLTEKGISFYSVLLRMQDWADAWITDRYRSPVTLIHRPCGSILQVEFKLGANQPND